MTPDQVLEEIILAYRNTISTRYQYESINTKYKLPESITEDTVDELRHYFLNYIYPEHEKRKELNDAFDSLDDYIKHPHKLMGILGDAIKLVFKYGRHLPKILNAGFDAMKTFQAATKFENSLVTEAVQSKMEAPFSSTKIDELMGKLSRKEINDFIEISKSLFNILHDKKLISKIKEVIHYLIEVMKTKQNTYSYNQIKGLEVGLEMITEGDKLFNQLSFEDQQKFIHVIIQIEQDNLDRIFNK